jgi:type II secretion system F domain protein
VQPSAAGEPLSARLANRWRMITPRGRVWIGASLTAGVVTGVSTGWLAALVLIPAVLLGVPYLLSEPANPEVDKLAALDRWLRFLGPSIATGKSIRDAIITTRSQVPKALTRPVARVVARLDLGWTTSDALITMADELKSADADGVLAALAIASSRGGVGARPMLAALAENTQMRLRALREIASERAKPRAVVRQVVVITLAILAGVWLLSPGYFAPYTTPIGQLLALLLVGLYVGALLMLRRRTLPKLGARFLRGGN